MPVRFQDKVEINKEGCWAWMASRDRDGYGRFWHQGNMRNAHRFSYTWLVGPIPDNMVIDHYRTNPGPRNAPCLRGCVNPEHLEVVTKGENTLRTEYWSSKKQCPKGHNYSVENTYIYTRASGVKERQCKICRKKISLDYYYNNKGGK
jgi:hypothetical protein